MSQVLVRVVLRIESLVSRMLCKQSSNWAILTLLPLKSKNKTNHLPYCILWGSLSFYRGLSSVSLTHFHYTPHPAIRMTPFIIHHILNHWGGGAWLSIQAPPLRDEPLLRLSVLELIILFWILWETVPPAPWASESLPPCQPLKFPSLPRPAQKLQTAGRKVLPEAGTQSLNVAR